MASKTLLVVAIVLALAASPLACPTNNRVNNAVFNGISFWGAYQCIALSACAQFATFGQVTGNCPSNSDYWCWLAQTSYSVFCAAATNGRRDEEQKGEILRHTIQYTSETWTRQGLVTKTFTETVEAELPETYTAYKTVLKAIAAKSLARLEANLRNSIKHVTFTAPMLAFERFPDDMENLMNSPAPFIELGEESPSLFEPGAFVDPKPNGAVPREGGGPEGWGEDKNDVPTDKVIPWESKLWCERKGECKEEGDCPNPWGQQNRPPGWPRTSANCGWKYLHPFTVTATFLGIEDYVYFQATTETAAHAQEFNQKTADAWAQFLGGWVVKKEDCVRDCKRNATNTF